jgi:hypothetical protein
MSDVFERIDASWHTLQAALDGVPEEALVVSRAIDEWSIKDVLGHLAFWKSSTAVGAERVAGFGPPASESDEHWQITNEREAEARANWPLEHVLDELHSQHARAVAAFQRVPPERLEDTLGDFIDHSDEHAAEIRTWRESAGY